MIIDKKHYTQKNGNKIIKCFTADNKYFYISDDVEDLLDDFCFRLHKESNTNHGTYYVQSSIRSSIRKKYDLINSPRRDIELHKLIFYKYAGYYYADNYVIDHLNSVHFDNVESNLDLVSKSENSFNSFSQGYQIIHRPNKPLGFHPRLWTDKNIGASTYKNEIERDLGIKITTGNIKTKLNELDSCRIQYYLEYVISNSYRFEFKNFRRYDLDILDKERRGVVSSEDALAIFLSNYKDNAWYYYRYGLEDLFNLYSLKKPDVILNSEGFIVDSYGNYLNPFLGGNIK